MQQAAPRDTGWFTSSYSGATNGNCVQVRRTDAATRVRDSKNPTGPVLTFTPATWRTFLRG